LPEADIEKRITAALSDSRSMLFSSELLQSATVEGLRRLQALADRCEAKLRFIYYLRSAFPLYVSTYNQAVKRSGFRGTLEQFVKERPISHYQTLRRLVGTGGPAAVIVRSYETSKTDLQSDFLQAIGVAPLENAGEGNEVVNPSLSAIDTNILRSLNRFLSTTQDSRVLSDWMLENASYQASGFGDLGLSPESCALIRERHKKDYEWIAEHFGEARAEDIFLGEKHGDQGPDLEGSAAHIVRFVGLLTDEVLRLRRVVHQLSTELKKLKTAKRSHSHD
jgi:hypothetical protein